MIINQIQSDDKATIEIRVRKKESKDYPFSLRFGYHVNILLTKEELDKLYTEVTETIYAEELYNETIDG